MQGKKDYQEKLFTNFQLSDRIPKENFYRRLKAVLDLNFMRKLTAPYYGDCAQQSIDPEVFMKLMLVGYLENIVSDRGLIAHCSMRLDILFFVGYDIDEELPWHSTISRTRALLPDEVFTQAFEKVLSMCVDKGMVGGHTQAIDSAPVKANASMDSLELKVPEEDLQDHLRKVRAMSLEDKEEKKDEEGDNKSEQGPFRKAKHNKAAEEQRKITASDKELKEIKSRNKNWSINQNERPGAKKLSSRYTSNKTHYSPVDPDARISVKPGKARKLNYAAQLAVDTKQHVITYIGADFADKKDNQSLQEITTTLQNRLRKYHLLWRNLAADTGYSSGENYAFLEQAQLESYIPAHGTYKGGPDGFRYHKEEDYWLCTQGEKVTFRKVVIGKKNNLKTKVYLTKPSQCKSCPIKSECIKNSPEKKITITYYRDEYERAIARVKSRYGQYIKRKRSSTVEPVFGTLTQFLGLRKINTRGISNANKGMLVAGMAYNLKKYLKYSQKLARSEAKAARKAMLDFMMQIRRILKPHPKPIFLKI